MYEKLILIGNLGSDPDMRYMPDGTAVTNFSMACNRNWTSQGEKKSQAVWYKVAVWGAAAEACNQYLQKGSQVCVEGKLKPDQYGNPRVWETNEGEARASYEVTADVVKFLSGSGEAHETTVEPQSAKETDDMPF